MVKMQALQEQKPAWHFLPLKIIWDIKKGLRNNPKTFLLKLRFYTLVASPGQTSLSGVSKLRLSTGQTVLLTLSLHRIKELVICLGCLQLVIKEFHRGQLIHWMQNFA